MKKKLIPFPVGHVRRIAVRLLLLSASRASLNRPEMWKNRPTPPESLGNMLQRLMLRRPVALLVLESIVAEMLAQIERGSPLC